MAHAQNDSLGSVSSLTSISSRTSVETYESLKEEIVKIEKSDIDLPKLVRDAEIIVDEKLTPAREKAFKFKRDSEEHSIDLDNVMKAMLVCAEESDGQRYAASAIVACTTSSKYPDVLETLVALGTTWLTHFLFVCQFSGLAMNRNNLMFSLVRASKGHENQPNKEPSELATPTFDETASHMGEGVGDRTGSFRDEVRRRILE